MKLIVGLGNKTEKYINTRHNVGFMFIDYILKEKNFTTAYDKKSDSNMCKVNLFSEDVIFIKPQTFMNLSGKSVSHFAKYYNIDMKDILVIYDDIDQNFSKYKFKKKSSHGGHNGMKDIINLLSTDDIPRLKIGIGRHDYMPVDKWVLSKFTKEEVKSLEIVFKNLLRKIELFITDDYESAING